MVTMEEGNPAPAIRFKRRKVTHPKRVKVDDDGPAIPTSQPPNAATPEDAHSPPKEAHVEQDDVPNLKEIRRNLTRPRYRQGEPARKAEPSGTELVQVDAPSADAYRGRFVAQTGQVVERDDKQM